ARATGRRRELAVRAALGAGQGRIIVQLLTESVLLALFGGLLGLGLAAAAVRAAPSLVPGDLPRLQQISLDGTVLVFTLAASLVAGILFGLLPAWQSRRLDLHGTLKEGGRSSTGASHRAQNALAVAEVALALVLLTGAGLLIQSLVRLVRVQPGFEPEHAMTMQYALSPHLLNDSLGIANETRALLERVQTAPGVVAAAETTLVPLSGSDSESGFWKAGTPRPSADRMLSAMQTFTTPGYLQAMNIPLLRGRFFNQDDNLQHPNVVVIDDVFAKHIFPGEDPIGQSINMYVMGGARVIGVVGHVKEWGLAADDTAKIGDQMAVLPAVRRAVAGAGNDQPVYGVQGLSQMIGASLAAHRFLMDLLVAFAVLAVILAGIGVYGVLAYAVAQRTQEVGIRMALGAAPSQVLRMILNHSLKLAAVGAAIGVVGAVLTTRFLSSDLYGVSATDVPTLAAVTALLLGLAALAGYIPARRAARV